MVLWRYNADGTLDPTLDGDGIVVHDNAAGGRDQDFGLALTIDAAGKIVVAGSSERGRGNFDMVLWRYNADGTLDPTLDGDGIVVHDNAAGGSTWDMGLALTIDAAGKIVVAGMSMNASGIFDMVLWRYNADGTLDPTWDGDGIVVHDNAAGGRYFDVGEALTIDAAGKIVVAGYSGNASGNDDMVLWRYK
jgi:uncharacterized delta-60 repeat protein